MVEKEITTVLNIIKETVVFSEYCNHKDYFHLFLHDKHLIT